MSEEKNITAIIEQLKKEALNAKYLPNYVFKAWAKQIHEGTYSSYTNAPQNIEQDDIDLVFDDSDNVDEEQLEDEVDDQYGDIVTVKGQSFVVCSGLVVPQALLKDEIIPKINEEMKKLGIDVDDVYNALMEDE